MRNVYRMCQRTSAYRVGDGAGEVFANEELDSAACSDTRAVL